MKEEKDGKQNKKVESFTKKVEIYKHDHVRLDMFCKAQRISKLEFFNEVISLLAKPNMSMSVFDEKYNLHQMNQANIEKHRDLVSILHEFKKDILFEIEKNNTNNLNFFNDTITKLIEFKTKENILIEESNELLKAYIDNMTNDKEADVIYKEAQQALDVKKNIISKIAGQPKIDTKEYLYIEGLVGGIPFLGESKTNPLDRFCTFYLADANSPNFKNPIWHYISFRKGDILQKLGLADKDSFTAYFMKVQKRDFFKLKGYVTDDKYKDKEDKITTRITFNVSEVIEYIPHISTK